MRIMVSLMWRGVAWRCVKVTLGGWLGCATSQDGVWCVEHMPPPSPRPAFPAKSACYLACVNAVDRGSAIAKSKIVQLAQRRKGERPFCGTVDIFCATRSGMTSAGHQGG